MNKLEKIAFIINPNSGVKQKLRLIEQIEEVIKPAIQCSVHSTERPAHATELAEAAVKDGADAVVAVGGDGSVNEVGKALINTHVPLGIIPMGSGNGFARHLNIPLGSKGALHKLLDFKTITIDTASLNNEPFLATAGLGFDAHVGWKFASFGRRGFLSYMQLTTQEFFNFKPKAYQLVVDGETIETKAFLINFANAGQYGNNAWIAPSASLSDGKLNVCILEQFPSRQVPDIIFKLFNKQIEQSKYYKVIQAKEIKVLQAGQYHIDGEPRNSMEEMTIRVVPNSLKVIV